MSDYSISYLQWLSKFTTQYLFMCVVYYGSWSFYCSVYVPVHFVVADDLRRCGFRGSTGLGIPYKQDKVHTLPFAGMHVLNLMGYAPLIHVKFCWILTMLSVCSPPWVFGIESLVSGGGGWWSGEWGWVWNTRLVVGWEGKL